MQTNLRYKVIYGSECETNTVVRKAMAIAMAVTGIWYAYGSKG